VDVPSSLLEALVEQVVLLLSPEEDGVEYGIECETFETRETSLELDRLVVRSYERIGAPIVEMKAVGVLVELLRRGAEPFNVRVTGYLSAVDGCGNERHHAREGEEHGEVEEGKEQVAMMDRANEVLKAVLGMALTQNVRDEDADQIQTNLLVFGGLAVDETELIKSGAQNIDGCVLKGESAKSIRVQLVLVHIFAELFLLG
jgi:hypothetical protein